MLANAVDAAFTTDAVKDLLRAQLDLNEGSSLDLSVDAVPQAA